MKNKTISVRLFSIILLCLAVSITSVGCSSKNTGSNTASAYSEADNWVYLEKDVTGKDTDVFFVNPTVYMGSEKDLPWSEYDEETKKSFVGAVNMEKGI